MTANEQYLYMQSAQREFEWLCGKIVHDGRDPYIVACALTEKLSRRLGELQALWDSRLTANDGGES
jgi:hypothetical protein